MSDEPKVCSTNAVAPKVTHYAGARLKKPLSIGGSMMSEGFGPKSPNGGPWTITRTAGDDFIVIAGARACAHVPMGNVAGLTPMVHTVAVSAPAPTVEAVADEAAAIQRKRDAMAKARAAKAAKLAEREESGPPIGTVIEVG